MIREGGRDRNTSLRYIFMEWRNDATHFLYRYGGNTQDMEDAVQEAVIILDNHVRNGKFKGHASLKSYFIGICKGVLYSKRRSQNRVDLSDQATDFDDVETQQPEVLMLKSEQKQLMAELLQMLEETCNKVLQLYRMSYSMQEIADQLQLGNTNNARQRVFKCRKKLTGLVSQHPLFANYFKGAL